MTRQVANTRIGEMTAKPTTWNPQASPGAKAFTYIDIASIDQAEKRINGIQIVEPKEAPTRARQIVRTGDVLVSTVRPNLNAVAYVSAEYEGATASTGFSVLRPRAQKADGRFLYHWVQHTDFINYLLKRVTGANYPAVSDGVVREAPIPEFTFDEQRRIAAILDKADVVRRKRRQALAETDTLLRSVFLYMFGDPGTNPHEYPVYHIGKLIDMGVIIDIQDGNHGELHPKSDDFKSSGVPFITSNSIRFGEINFLEIFCLENKWLKKLRVGFSRSGDVLLSHKGSVGFVAIVPPEAGTIILSPQVTYYRLHEKYISQQYFANYLRSSFIQQKLDLMSKQSTRSYIGLQRQKALPIMFPPLERQLRFGDLCNGISRFRKSLLSNIEYSEALFSSLSQRAFSGEL